MYNKMVVLLDGSELAEIVFHYAQELSGRMRIDLELLHVCSPHEAAQLPMRRAYMEKMAEELCAKAGEISARHGKELAAECIQSRGTVVVGYPAEEILKYVDEHGIDLVVMSTHGSSGVKAWHLGSVANKIIHASRVPVWLVPTGLQREATNDVPSKWTVVVPVSADKRSGAAIPHAVEILKQRDFEGELMLLHVADVPGIKVSHASLDQAEEERAKMKKRLEGIAEPLREEGVSVRTEVLPGDPVETVVDYLEDHSVQLLALATQAERGLSKMVFGSVTESIIQLVKTTPLLLVGE